MPFFSIIIPTYNRANFLRPTLHSVLSQTYTDYEVILVDDGSTDTTADIIEQEFCQYPHLVYIRKANEERSVARNTGIKAAKGEFIVFFDSDDLMHPDHLATLHRAILAQPSCDFFACKYQYNQDGAISYNEIQYLPEGFYDYSLLLKGNIFGVLVCVRKDLSTMQYFPVNFNILEDWIFNIMNLGKHKKIYLINKVTMTVIDHDFRTMKNNQKAIAARIKATSYLLENFDFSLTERILLQGYSFQFCAIHEYIDNNRKASFYYIKKAAKLLGWNKNLLLLLLKSIIGKKQIDTLKNLRKP